MNTTLNMCLIETSDGHVLVRHRLPKPDNAWAGLTFSGGHVEPGESVTTAAIREVREETDLTVSSLRSCGFVEWWNPERQSLCIVFPFRTRQFSGELRSS